jgi:hypothetical protein
MIIFKLFDLNYRCIVRGMVKYSENGEKCIWGDKLNEITNLYEN